MDNGIFTSTNAIRDGIAAGSFNTERIIYNQGYGDYAAQVCAYNEYAYFGDWYLPSIFELNQLYLQKTIVSSFGTPLADNFYWSSTEYTPNSAWSQNFINGLTTSNSKNLTFNVRAIRSF